MTAPLAPPRRRRIPFDYAFQFDLVGEVGRIHNRTVQVSTEADFVAVAIGYGVILRRDPIRFGLVRAEDIGYTATQLQAATRAPRPVDDLRDVPPGVNSIPLQPPAVPAPPPPAPPPPPAQPVPIALVGLAQAIRWPPTAADLRLEFVANALRRTVREDAARSLAAGRAQTPRQPAADLIEVLTRGVRLNPDLAATVAARGGAAAIPFDQLGLLFEEIPPEARSIRFLYQLFDQGTGRAFQSDPILSVAGLGIDDGDRPFRRFAAPITFGRMTSIRMEITEKSDVPGELHVALHGYRVLGGVGTPTEAGRVR